MKHKVKILIILIISINGTILSQNYDDYVEEESFVITSGSFDFTFGLKLNYVIMSEKFSLFENYKYSGELYGLGLGDTSLYSYKNSSSSSGFFLHNYFIGIKSDYGNFKLYLYTSLINPFHIRDRSAIDGKQIVEMNLSALGLELELPLYRNLKLLNKSITEIVEYENVPNNDNYFFGSFYRNYMTAESFIGLIIKSEKNKLNFGGALLISLFNYYLEAYEASDVFIASDNSVAFSFLNSKKVSKKNYFSMNFEISAVYDIGGVEFEFNYSYFWKNISPYIKTNKHLFTFGVSF